jgi:diguanylate cyclase (GGDEF)-like protein/PAS domain S-box-containing protein
MLDNSVFFSPQLKRMLGYGPQEMAPTLDTWTANLHPEDAPQVQRLLQDHLDGRRGRYEAEYRLRNRNGHYLWVHDHGRVCDRDGQGHPTRVVGMVQDITERKLMQLALEERAVHDSLTGLPNRRHGEEFLTAQLALCQRQGSPLGLCMLDLDHFKEINDLFGHLKGDEVLRVVAAAFSGLLRRSDLAFRWGGEEFMIICPGAELAQMHQVASRVREALAAQPWQAQFRVSPVTASIGLAVYPAHGQDGLSLVGAVDGALYRAKSSGRDRCEVAQG